MKVGHKEKKLFVLFVYSRPKNELIDKENWILGQSLRRNWLGSVIYDIIDKIIILIISIEN